MNTNYFACPTNVAGGHIRSIWQMAGNPTYHLETILPKGETELIFSFSDQIKFIRHEASIHSITPRCFVNGIIDRPIQLTAPKHQSFFGVVLNPLSFKTLLGIPAGEFLNDIIDLTLVNREFSLLWERLAYTTAFDQRVEIVLDWALKASPQIDGRDLMLANFLNCATEVNTVKLLSSHICYSPRQLNRKTRAMFGMSTESLLRYKRYMNAINRLHFGSNALTSVGLDSGYYDQAHFIREFKEFTDLTPGEYRKIKSDRPGHIFQ